MKLKIFLATALLTVSVLSWSDNQPDITLQSIQIPRQGLSHLLKFMDERPEIFHRPNDACQLLDLEQKEVALDAWWLFLDYMTTLDTISEQSASASLRATAITAHYRFALEYIVRIDQDPELVKWLNSRHKDLKLPKNFYEQFRSEMLGEFRTRQFEQASIEFRYDYRQPETNIFNYDLNAIHSIGRFTLLASNQTKKLKRSLYRVYYPFQKNIARGMGKVKFWRFGKTLITPEQAQTFSKSFEPGDFYLTRKEWRMTNVGIPGFWTHSALFIGTPEQRTEYFNTEEVKQWLRSKDAFSFEQLLRTSSTTYANHPGHDAMGRIQVLEALDDGVIFNSIESSLDADGAAVFRPRLSKLEKAKAIYNAFHYIGRPYDFHFDFDSDDALVCSELIYKSYQPGTNQQGIGFPLYRAVGKKMLTPNEIARWYDETVGTSDQQLDLVMFIDSNERDGVAFQSTEAAFIDSWKRPDWYIFTQPAYRDKTAVLAKSQDSDS
ncbi:MAG: YiiX/YebB-like N1pC/P60 family cysteine hydrolase [Reinekea sp.]